MSKLDLSRNELVGMPAGVFIDSLVAKYAFGYKLQWFDRNYIEYPSEFRQTPIEKAEDARYIPICYWTDSKTNNCIIESPAFQPSTNLLQSWQLMELFGKDKNWRLGWNVNAQLGTGWLVEDGGEADFVSLSGMAAEHPGLALCKAALLEVVTRCPNESKEKE